MKELMSIMSNNPEIPEHVRERHNIKNVAQQFESIFVNELMKTMRKTVGESFLSNMGKDTFTGMLDQEYAKMASTTGSFGLASVLEEQLSANISETPGEKLLRKTAWVTPVAGQVGSITKGQKFGADRPVHGDHDHHAEGIREHQGLDFGRTVGTPVRAASKGVINRIERSRGTAAGLWVGISHGEGTLNTRYMHLNSIAKDLKVGDEVRIGQQIGQVGNTGTASKGAHLHFEIFEPGAGSKKKHIDPEPYVRMWQGGRVEEALRDEKQVNFAKVHGDSDDSDDVSEPRVQPKMLGKFWQSRYQPANTGGGK